MHVNWLEHFSSVESAMAEDLGGKVKDHYIKVMTAMRDRVAASLTKYDLHSMGVAMSLLWMVRISFNYNKAAESLNKITRQYRPHSQPPPCEHILELRTWSVNMN